MNIQFPSELYKKLKHQAKAQGLSTAAYIIIIVRSHLNKESDNG